MELAPEFTGEPVRVTTLAGGIVVEVLVEGQGEQATEGKMVLFDHAAYRADTRAEIPTWKRRTRVGDEAGNPISAALQLAIAGQAAGFRARVFLPAAFVDATKPARAPAVGDVWLTLEIEQVRDYPQIVELDAFAGEPIATKVLDDGIEIYDYTPGQGPAAVIGDPVEFVTIAELVGGKPPPGSIRSREEAVTTMMTVVMPTNEILEGARFGMLRKYVVPPGYTWSPKFPPSKVEFVHYVQITWVEPR
jgi:hypothetical protein